MRILSFLILFSLFGCYKKPDASMTEKYIEVNNPGQTLGLSKLKVTKMDTTFGYPLDEQITVTYTVIDRLNGKQVNGNASFKMFFNKKDIRYKWRVYEDPFLADFYDTDTIQIQPYVWYRLSTWKARFHLYFFWDRAKGNYIEKFKPKPGAW